MEVWQLLVAIIAAIFGSTGFWSLISQRKSTNKELIDKIDKISKALENLEYKVKETEALNYRTRILRFNKELIKKEKHTEEEFDNILDACDEYVSFCNTYKREFKNHKATLSIENIKRCYQQCEEEHSFLPNE